MQNIQTNQQSHFWEYLCLQNVWSRRKTKGSSDAADMFINIHWLIINL